MRMIGQIENQPGANSFGDYLYLQGIKNKVEIERDGAWSIWVYDEEEIDRARQMLEQFRRNPSAPQFHEATDHAQSLRDREEAEEEQAKKRQFGREKIFRTGGFSRVGRLTLALMGISLVVAMISGLGQNRGPILVLFISLYEQGLPEVRQGQIWRLITPIFLHFGIIHLLFNMLWLYDLGSTVERRFGTGYYALMVLALAVVPNISQYLVGGPAFGGMSGVVFGLLGYVWIRGKYDPGSGLFLHPQTVTIMIIWYFLGLSGFIGGIANTAHTAGLVLGMIWGYVAAVKSGGYPRD
jgi:GlpG protein